MYAFKKSIGVFEIKKSSSVRFLELFQAQIVNDHVVQPGRAHLRQLAYLAPVGSGGGAIARRKLGVVVVVVGM